jgi:hypothetical protein
MRTALQDPEEIFNTSTVAGFAEFEQLAGAQLELLLEN